jgi:putative hydrolase of the HAD superfamily
VAQSILGPEIRAVFFDAVGTLIHPEPPASAVYAETGSRFGSRLTLSAVRRRFGEAFRGQEEIDRRHGLRTSEAREVERWRHIVAEVLDDVDDPDACFEKLFEHFARLEAWRCDPDAAVTLRALKERGYLLGAASNYDRRLYALVAGLPPLAPLQCVVVSSTVGWRKPAAEFFAELCRVTRYSPEQIVFVGDDWENDFQGARSAGMRPVHFDPDGKADLSRQMRITRLTDLLWTTPMAS